MLKTQLKGILTFQRSARLSSLIPFLSFLFSFLLAFKLEAKLPPLKTIFKKERVSKKETWLRLLYYKKGLFGGVKSLVDAKEFFFAKDGKENPLSELLLAGKQFKDVAGVKIDVRNNTFIFEPINFKRKKITNKKQIPTS